MALDFLDVDRVRTLPLWAQVLIASRLARRAAYALSDQSAQKTRHLLTVGCDAVDCCATAGEWLNEQKPAINAARDHAPATAAFSASRAFYYVADAVHAANDSLDFSAAENACENSSQAAMAHASEAPGLSPVQVRIFVAADADQLRFACDEASVGRYDGLGTQVMGRMAPVYPPDASG